MIRRKGIPEILAPCGSYDILTAAVKAGADACYIGGSRFGARAYADNFDSDSILRTIDYAHLRDVRLYLTVNTLFKNSEIKELTDYILPYYEAGLDAVIVQDLGAFSVIKESFPDLNIHCSTQMNITSVHGARLMKKMGASRIVAAREMTLDEIKKVKTDTDIEVEIFVHGAMCYSYSGQCLLSSAAGKRSGNRGRCAQPCRKCYDGSYILSMKDMCALSLIPELISAGADSFKIEGRMKNAYYVASAVDAYRQMRDAFIAGRFDKNEALRLKDKLAAIYNRGGFTDGYFYYDSPSKSDMDMISRKRPNNLGTLIGRAVGVRSGRVEIKLSEDVFTGDVLELKCKDKESFDITLANGGRDGHTIYAPAPKTRLLDIPFDVYRTRCNKLINEIEDKILSGDNYSKIHIDGVFTAKTGKPMSLRLMLLSGGAIYDTEVLGETVSPAQKSFADENSIRDKILMLGGTDYVMDDLSLDVSKDAFVPAGEVKRLRRLAISSLEDKITSAYRRAFRKCDRIRDDRYICEKASDKSRGALCGGHFVHIRVCTIEQLKAALGFSYAYAFYMDRDIFDEAKKLGLVAKIRDLGIKMYINMPYVVKSDLDVAKYLPKGEINGIYIRNIDTFAAVINEKLYSSYELVCAASLYGYNNMVRRFLRSFYDDIMFEMPYELTLKELSELDSFGNIFNVYGHRQVMISAQCVERNRYGCGHDNGVTVITDDKANRFFCKSVCGECCNVIYNGVPFGMPNRQDEILGYISPDYVSMDFTVENEKETADILDMFEKHKSDKTFTSGHCYRGVE